MKKQKIKNKINNILRLDLDIKFKKKTIEHLKNRIAYLNDTGYLNINKIENINLIFKTSFSCKIILKKKCSIDYIFKTQLILGSDYKKEVCSMINYYKHKMFYPDRLFEIKRYPDGKYIIAKNIDITKIIIDYVKSSERKKFSSV